MNVFCPNILADKVALITGGGTGIGKEIARTLATFGAKVVICGRREEVLNATREEFLQAGLECLAFSADVRDSERVEKVVADVLEHHGRLDIVVNNAAGNFPAPLSKISYNGFKAVVDIDLLGTYNVSKATFEAYLKENGGSIINISAPFEHWGVSYQAHVAAAKTGVDSLTRTCAVEWSPLGIRVNSVAPGAIGDTEGLSRFESVGSEKEVSAEQTAQGTKQDIANAVLFLVSDAAAFISGVSLRVDGAGSIDMLKMPVH